MELLRILRHPVEAVRARHRSFNWGKKLQELSSTNQSAQAILREGLQPGKLFDGPTHRAEIAAVIANEIRIGAQHVGLGGSRARRAHTSLRSDVDLIVINPLASGLTFLSYQDRLGTADGIHVMRFTPKMWEYFQHDDGTPAWKIYNSIVTGEIRWLWTQANNGTLSTESYVDRIAIEKELADLDAQN